MSINFDSDKPIYLQLADRIREAIMAGDLKRGEAIPSVRQLSAEYRLNPQTILNATQLLVNEGLLEKRRGRGYFVTDLAQGSLKESAVAEFKETSVPALVRQAKMLNISREALSEMIKKQYNN
ncbi:MAG: GntR family transcriptional regulator [Candidatus Marinimicrobia bacterium]|nr:GntR family transcriptional regulator [Candidatus Neomarinimicrobiota bacterium]MDZ7796408.1 GntR family transcriptional regulator [Candidatus Neomarinimicrobiota bacterium]